MPNIRHFDRNGLSGITHNILDNLRFRSLLGISTDIWGNVLYLDVMICKLKIKAHLNKIDVLKSVDGQKLVYGILHM